jgi:hypothetical protein
MCVPGALVVDGFKAIAVRRRCNNDILLEANLLLQRFMLLFEACCRYRGWLQQVREQQVIDPAGGLPACCGNACVMYTFCFFLLLFQHNLCRS